jgi:hypothetical protein
MPHEHAVYACSAQTRRDALDEEANERNVCVLGAVPPMRRAARRLPSVTSCILHNATDTAWATHVKPRRSNTVRMVCTRPSACTGVTARCQLMPRPGPVSEAGLAVRRACICTSAWSMRYTHSRSVSCASNASSVQCRPLLPLLLRVRHAQRARRTASTRLSTLFSATFTSTAGRPSCDAATAAPRHASGTVRACGTA